MPDRSSQIALFGHGARRSVLRNVLGWLVRSVGLIIFIWLVFRCDWEAIGTIVLHIRWALLLPSLALFLVTMGLKAQRFRLLSRDVVGRISFRYAFLIYFAAYFVGTITPGRVGEFAKVQYLRRDKNVPVREAFRPVLLDRLYDLLCLAVVGLVGWAILDIGGLEPAPNLKVVFFVMLAAVLVSAPAWTRPLLRVLGRVTFLGDRMRGSALWLERSLGVFYTRTGGLCAAITIVAYLVGFLMAYLIARSVSINIPYWEFCAIMAVVCLAILLPITVSGLGTREAACVFLFGLYGVPAENALSFSLLYFIVGLVFGGIIGAICWLTMPLSKARNLAKEISVLRRDVPDLGKVVNLKEDTGGS